MERCKKIAIITGASSGIGKEFTKQLSTRKDIEEIWVIARRTDLLKDLQNYTTTPIKCFSLDLTKTEDIFQLESVLHKEYPSVQVLVNAAGMGKTGPFVDQTISQIHTMIDLNCKALVDVTKIVIPFMVKDSTIYQISSVASFQPMPYFSIYAASKSFVTSFSLALEKEIKPRGIHVVTVCPYWVKDTQFISIANTSTYYSCQLGATTSAHVVQRALHTRSGICTTDVVSTLERGISKVVPDTVLSKCMEIFAKLRK